MSDSTITRSKLSNQLIETSLSSSFHQQHSCCSTNKKYRRSLIASCCETSKLVLTLFRYGPFTLVAATFLGFAAYSSARTTLKELVPWLPLALALFVLLTVYFFPKLRQLFSRDSETLIAMEEGQGYPLYGTPVEPGSVQSDEDIRSRQRSLEVDRWLEYDISHVGGIGRPASRHSGRLSTRESDIDLDDSQSVARLVAQRMVSPSRQTYNISNLPRTALESGFSTQRPTAMAPPSQLNQPRDYQQRSLSPESIVVEGPSSTSAESERPLLG